MQSLYRAGQSKKLGYMGANSKQVDLVEGAAATGKISENDKKMNALANQASHYLKNSEASTMSTRSTVPS